MEFSAKQGLCAGTVWGDEAYIHYRHMVNMKDSMMEREAVLTVKRRFRWLNILYAVETSNQYVIYIQVTSNATQKKVVPASIYESIFTFSVKQL